MRPSCPRIARLSDWTRMLAAQLLVALVLLWPALALAGTLAMIPPGQEQRIRALVSDSIEAATLAGELPIELDARIDIRVDRDHFRVTLHPASGTRIDHLPQLLVFHPDASPAIEGGIAQAVFARCGEPGREHACTNDEMDPWRGFAATLARRRVQDLSTIWHVEVDDEPAPVVEVDEEPTQVRTHYAFDRAVILGVIGLGLMLVLVQVTTGRDQQQRPSAFELVALLFMVAAFAGATMSWTPLVPLHEHNSFVARSDCAANAGCLDDPIAAWNLSALNGYSLLLEHTPANVAGLSALSLALSCLGLILVWGLARQIMRLLGRPELGAVAGLGAVLVLASHPVAWRLAGSASFWPWSLDWTLAAALAGAWATEACRRDQGALRRWAGAFAWLVAAACLAIAVGGNFVLLTLGPALVLAPLAWAWPAPEREPPRPRDRLVGLALILGAVGVFALIASVNYEAGFERVAGEDAIGDRLSWPDLVRGLPLLLADRRVGTMVWVIPMLAALAWLSPRLAQRPRSSTWLGLRVLAPLAYLALVPSLFLLVAAGELLGSGYPVGFINHHWELWWSALAAGLGLASIVASLDQRWPLTKLIELAKRTERVTPSWALVLPLVLGAWALVRNPRADEGWAFATGSRLVERELVALEQAFTRIPAHDLLVIPPRLLEPMTDAPTRWDPIEVNFPIRSYDAAMRDRGLEPARVVGLDQLDLEGLDPTLEVLIYVGTSLRCFQPHEIEAGVVPDDFERVELRHLRETHHLVVVDEFPIRGEQHEAISMRLAGDRMPEIELGFYSLHPRE